MSWTYSDIFYTFWTEVKCSTISVELGITSLMDRKNILVIIMYFVYLPIIILIIVISVFLFLLRTYAEFIIIISFQRCDMKDHTRVF